MLSEVTNVYRNQVKLVTGLRGEQRYTENVIRGNPRLQKSGKTSYRTQRGADIYIENVIRGNPRLQKPGKTSYRTRRGQIYIENVIRSNPRLQKSGKTSYRTQRGADIYRKCYQRQPTSTEIR